MAEKIGAAVKKISQAELSGLRQLLGSEGEPWQQHSHDDQGFQHCDCNRGLASQFKLTPPSDLA
jgi:hypothetical protein